MFGYTVIYIDPQGKETFDQQCFWTIEEAQEYVRRENRCHVLDRWYLVEEDKWISPLFPGYSTVIKRIEVVARK